MTILETTTGARDTDGVDIKFLETDGASSLEEKARLSIQTIAQLWKVVNRFEIYCTKIDDREKYLRFEKWCKNSNYFIDEH